MYKKIDHIGFAVPNLDEAIELYQGMLGINCTGSEEVADQKVRVAFFPVGESSLELLEPTAEDSPIAKFIAKRGQGIHHLALGVDDVEQAIAALKAKGVQMIDETPRKGAHGARIAFVHPKSTPGILIELCERKQED